MPRTPSCLTALDADFLVVVVLVVIGVLVVVLNKLKFILPCKSDFHLIFGIAPFVTRFTHV